MNDVIVGMENLPNVFIQKIMLYPRENGYRIRVQVGIYDHSVNASWKNRIDDLKVKVYFSSDLQEISLLNNGNMSLFDIDSSTIGTFTMSAQALSISEIDGDYDIYLGTFDYGTPINPQNLNVYAACFVDGFGFGVPIFDKFYGPMSAERIFGGGQINTRSNYFYYPNTNEEYGGPVHQKPDGTYMEGSLHTDISHEKVQLVTEENYKIQNFNIGFGTFSAQEYNSYVNVQGTAQTQGPAYQTQTSIAPTGVPSPTEEYLP